MQTIDNKTGKVMQITLSDCSVVALYPNGILQYLPAFEENRRILYLNGKARFDVRKDKVRPFTVYASGIATTALGTRFIISVLDDKQVSVTLKEGIVKVSPEHGRDTSMHVLLRPGDQLIVNSRKFHSYSLTHEAASAFAKEKRTVLKIPDDTTTKKKQGWSLKTNR
ncbi:FecR family protein [Niabella ginsengisoli]|uniref:FecR domain-containing protein n=1 Tax=Niabella ginsengisoli TaxID=522298 RepID=A0ABS9SDL6_9BACT|nr:FecR domain-containing protein [Niabella ginsengisoli]MCH5596453.1 FecR domain-containing protein [Niabella ginsengisoli]